MPARIADEVLVDTNARDERNNAARSKDASISITGFSGRLPESSNIEEFKKNLFEGVDMVNDDPRRWPKGLYDLPDRLGKIKDEDLENFDQQFFSVHQKQAECMDAQLRMLLEVTYEAIVDAGVNPQEIRGSRTGVYIGVSSSETEQYWCNDPDRVNGYGLTGCARAMFANRLSFTFDFTGPSYCVDTACSSSLYALEQAFSDMKRGVCDNAVVAGVGLILKPTMSLQFKRLNMLSQDGKCKAFDESGSGYVRSDGCVAIFLQNTKQAKRIYASILNVRTNTDGNKEQGITYPSGKMQNKLIKETYEEIGLNPHDVVYVEAHGTGTKVGDPQEVNSITDFFCKDRPTPLLIGSVKSNMGHSEPASGVCSIAKVLIAMEEGIIPSNLHYSNPNPDLYGLVEGRLKVVDKNMKWNGGIIGINSFGFGGANAHVILKSNPKPKAVTPREGPPKLVTVSGRTFDAVQNFLEDVEKHRHDEEYLALINEIFLKNIPLHYYRGYTVLNNNGSAVREVLEHVDEKRQIWFIYSGMGSQWANMARDLMSFEVFSQSIHRCSEILRQVGMNLMDILLNSTDESFDNIMNSFTAIAAVQIALTDMLTSLGIHPDGIIGHSVGELGCAYADGCFTPEQTVLAAYWRGKSLQDTKLAKGKMAAVGVKWEDCNGLLTPGVFPVCHNSEDNVTISGPEEEINSMVEVLTAKGIFAKAVNSSGYAFHSKYIADAGPKLRKSLEKIIPNPKNRSARWISTSIPETAWNTPVAKQSSAAYHVNNLLSPVLFYEALQKVPKNAICIEVAPTGLLQAILKRALDSSCTNLSLIKRNHENNVEFFLSNIGKLYAAGAQPNILKMVRPVSFPVGRGTPMLNSKLGWDHSQKWMVPKYGSETSSGETVVEINLADEGDAFLSGHTIDGRILFPATGYMTLAWKTFSKMRGFDFHRTPVIIENVVFHRATILNKENVVKFGINFFDGSGDFEICEGGTLTVSGKISVAEKVSNEELPQQIQEANNPPMELKLNDVYKELRLRGYDYGGEFKGIVSSDINATSGYLAWTENWVSFMDTMLQFSILKKDLRDLYLPTRIDKVIINPTKHYNMIQELDNASDDKALKVNAFEYLNVIRSGGVEMRGLKASLAPRRSGSQNQPKLERYAFVPSKNTNDLHENPTTARMYALTEALHIVLENSAGAMKIKVVELDNNRSADVLLAQTILRVIEDEPTIAADVAIVTSSQEEHITTTLGETDVRVVKKNIAVEEVEKNCHMALAYDLLSMENSNSLKNILKTIKEDGFILFDESNLEYQKTGGSVLKMLDLVPIVEQKYGDRLFVLARLSTNIEKRNSCVVHITNKNFEWVEELKACLAASELENKFVYVVSENEEFSGAVGFLNCLKNEAGGKFVRMIYIEDKAEPFSLTSQFYIEQLRKDLVANVYKNGSWGTYRHFIIDNQNDIATLPVEHAYVNALVKGDLASLKWIEGPVPKSTAASSNGDYELCSVYYAPINFRDVMLSSGKLSADALPGDLAQQDCVLGLEFAGRDSTGKRIMAMVPAKSLASTCLASKRMMWAIPDNWSMEEASTVPCVYATVYYALVVRGQMKKGEAILIHAGSGGVGQAAISVALSHGLTVFTTVGSVEKREYLKKRFPQLLDSHIGNSRNTTFEQMVMNETKGKGVDLVLNSLAEEKLQASVRCLGLNGRFLEIGKFDLNNNSPLGMSVFLKNTSFHGILLDSVMEGEESMQDQVVKLVADGIKSGAVRPLQTSVFNEMQIEQAFRFMASGKHIGKVVIKVRAEETTKSPLKPDLRMFNAIPRTYMHPGKVYILIGGLGGFGLELTNWLVLRGAKKIVLTSRSGVKTGYQKLMITRWTQKNCTIKIDTNDVTSLDGCRKLLKSSSELGSVGGIFNLAAVLRDGLIEDQTKEDFEAVCKPKIEGTIHLDKLSRELCPELDYFVCFSSVSCGRGNIGQTNYGLANSAMERLCESRQVSGFPGTAIQWGAIGDTGLVIENLGDNNTVIGGTLPQRMSSCLQTIDIFLQQPHPVLASMVVAEKRKNDSSSGVSLVTCVANILGLRDIRNVQDSSTLADLGMDSLMGAEIKQTLERNFDIVMSAQEIRMLTFGALNALTGESANATSDSPPEAASSSLRNTPSPFGDGTQVVFASELMPTKSIVQLKSSAPACSKKGPIFFVHPIEGFIKPLERLAARLDCPVYGVQCTADAPVDSIDDLAAFYIKQIKTVQPKGPYAIAGYSFGALIAFVMVTQLEKNNELAKLVMLDGAPKYVNWYTQSHKQRYNSSEDMNQNQSYALAYFGMVCGNMDYGGVARLLNKIPTWEAKVEKCAELLHAEIEQPIELIKQAAITFWKKLSAADAFEAKRKVKCHVTLIKPTENYAKLEEDYGLSEVCEKGVDVLTVEGNHRTFLIEEKSLETIESIIKDIISS
ncbi:fatty acid synthase [Eupeodes corollae]|uniref:fatty acid synthase n=1 Tax=Eupeodes corollae TaxID=290404 RepID=UPI00248F7F4D|nr:fatty acid synthase [Eupeodes corollae]XP_055919371.1 fatty acid synthase [Eupeodes corollae]